MARYPGAQWHGPVPNETPGAMLGHLGLVLHIMEGTEPGTDAWFHNPASQVSAHFGNPKTGQILQWVDTADKAWAEAAANPYWVSVENEGNSGDSLTTSQVENLAHLLAWLHVAHDIPLQLTDSPNTGGLGYHAMGGAAWGGHYDCPGAPVIAQRPAIVARAQQLVTASKPVQGPVNYAKLLQILLNAAGDHLALDGIKGPLTKAAFLGYMEHVPTLGQGAISPAVKILQAMLGTQGANLALDGDFGTLTFSAVLAFQRTHPACGPVDGLVGPKTKLALSV